MKIILKKDVENLGRVGDVVEVKDGYGRNYLIPQGMGIQATRSNMKVVDELKRNEAKKAKKAQTEAEKLAAELSRIELTYTAKVGEDDKLYGAVTNQVIAELLKEKDVQIDRHQIVLEEPIKELGMFEVPVKAGAGVKAQIKLWVIKEEA